MSDLKLYPYQQEGVEFLRSRDRALLADQQGLGKTAQVLCAIDARCPTTVVCPAIAKRVWLRECLRWRPDLKPHILDGEKFRFPAPGELLITNFERLPSLPLLPNEKPAVITWEYLTTRTEKPRFWNGAPPKFSIIADEAQYLSGRESRRSRDWDALRCTASLARGKIWILTGTPLMSWPLGLWNVLGAAGLNKVAYKSMSNFQKLFGYEKKVIHTRKCMVCGTYATELTEGDTCSDMADHRWKAVARTVGQWPPSPPRMYEPERIAGFRSVSLRRLKEEVLEDLPPKTYEVIDVELTPPTTHALDVLGEDLEKMGLPLGDVVEQGISFEHMMTARRLLAEEKMQHAIPIVESFESAEEPLVVFSDHRAPVETLGAREGWGMLVGGMGDARRQKVIDDFQAGLLKGVAVSIKSAGTGITLHRASTALFIDEAWTPAENEQAADRIHRIGQNRGVRILRMVSTHPIDKRVSEILFHRREMYDSTIA